MPGLGCPSTLPCGPSPSTSGRGALGSAPRPPQAHLRRGMRLAALWGFGKVAAPKASPPEVAWEAKYGEQQLRHGMDLQQGPREGMEDFTHLVEKARCGYLFACESPGEAALQPGRPSAPRHPPHEPSPLLTAASCLQRCTTGTAARPPGSTCSASCTTSSRRSWTRGRARWSAPSKVGGGAGRGPVLRGSLQQHPICPHATMWLLMLVIGVLDAPRPCAETDGSGLCCPLELRPVLADAFRRTDAELLSWLEGAWQRRWRCLAGLRSGPPAFSHTRSRCRCSRRAQRAWRARRRTAVAPRPRCSSAPTGSSSQTWATAAPCSARRGAPST